MIFSAAVEELHIHGASGESTSEIFSDGSITLIENKLIPVRCISRRGSPPPEMEIFLGRTDYTKYFRFDSVPSMTGDIGFRYLHMTTMLVTDHFRVSSNDDGKKLNCIAQVPGLPQVVKSILIIVHCELFIIYYIFSKLKVMSGSIKRNMCAYSSYCLYIVDNFIYIFFVF